MEQRRDATDQPARDALGIALVHEARLLSGGTPRDDRTTQLLLFIEHNCDRGLSLRELAEVAGESTWAVLRRFRRDLGISPMQAVKRARVAWSERLIAQGMSKGDAARRVGYAGVEQLGKARRSL